MATNQPFRDQRHILLILLLTTSEVPSDQLFIDDKLQGIISDARKIITQDIPEEVRKKLHQLGAQVEERFYETSSHRQILPEASRLSGSASLPTVQADPVDEPRGEPVEHDSSTVTTQPSKQILTIANTSSRGAFDIADLQLYAKSPEVFLKGMPVSIDKLGVLKYIKQLEKSGQTFNIAWRFAVLELWYAHQLWSPRPIKDFNKKLGPVPIRTLYRWLRQGKTLFLLKTLKGLEVLFSDLTSNLRLDGLSPELKLPTGTNLCANYNDPESFLEIFYAKRAKKLVLAFKKKGTTASQKS
ncbi:hypothetical protein QSH57_004378 [Fusarium oxysporum f. sp. vasinfectum]|nr:hypothetical protein QSH57_004378 [Fusarium oxysporum f. sp. vasinfectum]